MSDSMTSDADPADPLETRIVLQSLWAWRWRIVASSVIAAAMAALAAFLMTPVYRSSVILIPVNVSGNGLRSALTGSMGSLGGLAELAGVGLGGNNSAKEEALAVMTSRQFTDRFILEKNLLPVFFPRKWDETSGKWKVPEDKQPTLADAYKYFDSDVRTISEDKKTGMVALRIDWRKREEAADWANELVRRLNAEMQHRAIRESEASLAYLKSELDRTGLVGTREAINRLIESQINRRMLANVTSEYAFRIVDPAIPADDDDMVRPRKLVMIAIGGLLGALLGVVAAIVTRR